MFGDSFITAFNAFSSDCVYKRVNGGIVKSLKAIVRHGIETNTEVMITGVSEKETIVDLLCADVDDPRSGDIIVANGHDYKVVREFHKNEYIVRLIVK